MSDQLRMAAKVHPTTGSQALRQRTALNFMKCLVLGPEHRPGEPQTEAVRAEFDRLCLAATLDWRTWTSWFSPEPPNLRDRSLRQLDAFIESHQSKMWGELWRARPRNGFLREMVTGGLFSNLRRRTDSKHLHLTLQQRAADYLPATAWQLHLDSLEAASLVPGDAEFGWLEEKRIAAARILFLLYCRWSPRRGDIYSQLTSELQLMLSSASDRDREHIVNFIDRQFPGRLDELRSAPAKPNWEIVGVQHDCAPVHSYKLLFALAADTKFLVGDRLENWFLDLATSGLAMCAHSWTEPDVPLLQEEAPESRFWEALDDLFFSAESGDGMPRSLKRAYKLTGKPWSDEVGIKLLEAGRRYRATLESFGVDAAQVSELVRRVWKDPDVAKIRCSALHGDSVSRNGSTRAHSTSRP